MKAIEFVQSAISELHGVMIDDVKVLKQEQLAWKPAPGANPVGFLFWHYMRTADNMIQSFQGKPSIWESEKWHEKLRMDAKAQGTGFKEPEVAKVAALPLAELIAYGQRVAGAANDYLKSLDDAKLDYAPDPQRPQRTIGMMLRNFLIAHGWWHLGEIKYVKGMLGMPAAR